MNTAPSQCPSDSGQLWDLKGPDGVQGPGPLHYTPHVTGSFHGISGPDRFSETWIILYRNGQLLAEVPVPTHTPYC